MASKDYINMTKTEKEDAYIEQLQDLSNMKELRWTGSNKVGISIYEMDKSYIMNCIELLHRRDPGRISKKWIELFLEELSNRGNDWWS